MCIDVLIARHIRDLRKARGFTLEQLARRSGVSRSMISLIERQETSATAVVLDRLAGALGVPLAELFTDKHEPSERQPLVRRAAQPVWSDPESGYVRRQISPARYPSPIELVEVIFPAGQTVIFGGITKSDPDYHQQLWMLAGEMEIALGDDSWQMLAGDCLAMTPGAPIRFSNHGRDPARYLLALTRLPYPGGRP